MTGTSPPKCNIITILTVKRSGNATDSARMPVCVETLKNTVLNGGKTRERRGGTAEEIMASVSTTSQPDQPAESLVAAYERACHCRTAPAILQPSRPILQ